MGLCNFVVFGNLLVPMLIPNCTQNNVITYTKFYDHPKSVSQLNQQKNLYLPT